MSRLCDIAFWRRHLEFYQREAIELARVGDDEGSTIFRQGAASVTDWIETLNRQKVETGRNVS
jgi:hypothetical protein